MKRIYVVGTADTKGEELAYLAGRITAAGGSPLIVDVGTKEPSIKPDIAAAEVAKHGLAGTREALASGDRGRAVAAMAAAFTGFAASQDDIAGIIGIGGGGGTSIVTSGMRELPLGLPKIMVSTLAAGDVSPYVGVSDIVMMPAITDMAGLNRISRAILGNAASAIVAMATRPAETQDGKLAIGLTMFGVTTTCVTGIVDHLKDDYDCLVFHATGTGGRTMEKLVGFWPARRRHRHHHDGGLRLPVRRGASRHRRPVRCNCAHKTALCRLGRRARHGQFLGARDGA